MGLFWPCPTSGHPGTPRLFEGGRFYHPDGKARFHAVPYRRVRPRWSTTTTRSWLTTGRVVSQYLSGTQTRRIGALVEQYPEPLCEMHPRLAEQLGIADGDLVTRQRRGAASMTLPAQVVDDDPARHRVHPLPLAGRQGRRTSCTNRALDPISKMPEFKVAAVRVRRRAPTRPTRAISPARGPT